MKWVGLILVLLVLVAVAAMFPIMVKNGLIEQDESVSEAWSQIDTQLQRRADLVPNLVSTVKGYAAHEKEVFIAVADARSKLLAARTPASKASASGLLSGALGRLMAISENYPQLKADTSFVRLQDELTGTENRIAVARTRYNKSVKSFNAAIRKFPGSLFADGLELTKAEYYEPPANLNVDTVPEVKF
ncbi:MAG: LemA family protein [Verrucomicrobia bacterium]|nr:LemA family protein [Verrucomicrobiota bacterium]MBT7067651.1 LemA family protein [Verrucomicrobiota bacterium]